MQRNFRPIYIVWYILIIVIGRQVLQCVVFNNMSDDDFSFLQNNTYYCTPPFDAKGWNFLVFI